MAADIISTLPNAVLCHILSFLRTKHVVSTSILSKRWKNIWRSVLTLYFKTTLTNTDQSSVFENTVNSVLHSRHAAVKSFRLNLIYEYPEIQSSIVSITNWLDRVVQRGVECLDLSLWISGCEVDFRPYLPIPVVTCRTLVVLKLCRYGVQVDSAARLPCLKTLHLINVWFPKLRDFLLFLTRCPVLEDLLVYRLFYSSGESLTYNEWNSFCLTNLISADIDYFDDHLTSVRNVPYLRVEIYQEYFRSDFVPTFHNLTELEILSPNYDWRFLPEVLKHCPMLRKLVLDEAGVNLEERWSGEDDEEHWVKPNFVPQCLSLHLRTCKLYNFIGLQTEILLARYILENAKVLQTMAIWNYGQPDIEIELSSCLKASASCQLTFVHYF